MIKVYFNPDCSKCNATECILIEQQIKFDKVEYLINSPDKQEIHLILKKLGLKAHELIRTSEPIYKLNFEGKRLTEEEWMEAMVMFPILIERPILIDGERAIICRPPEKLYDFLKIG